VCVVEGACVATETFVWGRGGRSAVLVSNPGRQTNQRALEEAEQTEKRVGKGTERESNRHLFAGGTNAREVLPETKKVFRLHDHGENIGGGVGRGHPGEIWIWKHGKKRNIFKWSEERKQKTREEEKGENTHEDVLELR